MLRYAPPLLFNIFKGGDQTFFVQQRGRKAERAKRRALVEARLVELRRERDRLKAAARR